MSNCKTVEQRFSNAALLPSYEKSKDFYDLLENRMEKAIEHAKKLEQHHIEQGNTELLDSSINPYTSVWKLVEILKG